MAVVATLMKIYYNYVKFKISMVGNLRVYVPRPVLKLLLHWLWSNSKDDKVTLVTPKKMKW